MLGFSSSGNDYLSTPFHFSLMSHINNISTDWEHKQTKPAEVSVVLSLSLTRRLQTEVKCLGNLFCNHYSEKIWVHIFFRTLLVCDTFLQVFFRHFDLLFLPSPISPLIVGNYLYVKSFFHKTNSLFPSFLFSLSFAMQAHK